MINDITTFPPSQSDQHRFCSSPLGAQAQRWHGGRHIGRNQGRQTGRKLVGVQHDGFRKERMNQDIL